MSQLCGISLWNQEHCKASQLFSELGFCAQLTLWEMFCLSFSLNLLFLLMYSHNQIQLKAKQVGEDWLLHFLDKQEAASYTADGQSWLCLWAYRVFCFLTLSSLSFICSESPQMCFLYLESIFGWPKIPTTHMPTTSLPQVNPSSKKKKVFFWL